jgi:hypothetical protein
MIQKQIDIECKMHIFVASRKVSSCGGVNSMFCKLGFMFCLT